MDQAEQLRNIIKANSQLPLARVITVTSGKGGVGKSVTTLIHWLKSEKRFCVWILTARLISPPALG